MNTQTQNNETRSQQTRAMVNTGNGAVLLKKLCRHFAHKVPTTLTEEQGIIEFPFGRCLLTATASQLDLTIEVGNPDDTDKAEQVVGSHLQRMSREEELTVNWNRI